MCYYICSCSAGRYCEWTHKTVDSSAETETFEEYLNTLRLVCDEGESAYLNWTVALETPDLVYYQVFAHVIWLNICVYDTSMCSQFTI
jgi:hypothetical protein